jgi:hypothetical protein
VNPNQLDCYNNTLNALKNDAAKSKRVMQAMLQMVKLDLNRLKQAYENG